MNKRQKLVQQQFLNNEEAVIRRLKAVYNQSLKDINEKSKQFQAEINGLQALIDVEADEATKATLKSMQQSKIYQKQYQDALKKQINGILDTMQVEEFKTVDEYLKKCYEDGFIGTMYDLQGQGIPMCMPLDQEAMVRAVQTDSKISQGLYQRLGEDVDLLKRKITAQVSRGIATGMTFQQVAQQLSNYTNIGYNNAVRIARTEGHRIQVQSTMDACYKAKDIGADIVKQWDSALDKRTRESHAKVDGEIRELDKPFSNGLMFPGDPHGGAAEVVNCRCALLQRAKWALDDKELETLKERAAYYGLDKTDNFNDYKSKYLKAVETIKHKSNKVKATTIEEVNASGSQMLGDAYERHRIDNNLNSVPYEKIDKSFNIISADYSNLSVETSQVFNDTFSELIEEYDTPLQKIRTMSKQEAVQIRNAFATTHHDYTTDMAEIIINPVKCKDIKDFRERMIELSKKGYAVKIPDEVAEKYVATHEFAHTLINLEQPLNNKTNWVNADYKKIKNARKEIEAVYEEYMNEVRILTEKRKKAEWEGMMNFDEIAWKKSAEYSRQLSEVKISNYSLESMDEFMAEAFTNEKIGISSNKYAKEVVSILDKYFKR